MYQVNLSVRELVEFLYSKGDLTSSFSSVERAALGSRIHRQLQKNAGKNYQSEVFLKHETILDEIEFHIEGRADGIISTSDKTIIDEIKTTYLPYEKIEDTHFVHWAQAYCYGYFYMCDHELKNITIQLTYYQLELHKTKIFQQTKSFEELKQFYIDTLHAYLKWAQLRRNLKIQTSITTKQLQFPFPAYRTSQRELAVGVYRAIDNKKTLYAQAPTGIGKTVSTLFPSIKALGEKKVERIFYLCAKNITASVANQTMDLFYEQNVKMKCVHIHAKDKMCFLEERNCDPNVCPYAKDYYGKLNDALYELLQDQDHIDKDLLLTYGKRYELCPFELSLDVSMFCDVIICDYNYVFDPRVYLKRYFSEKSNTVLLVDEAHNMVERARTMYSTSLKKSSFTQVHKLIDTKEKTLRRSLRKIMKLFDTFPQVPFEVLDQPSIALEDALDIFCEECDRYMQQIEEEIPEEIRTLYFDALNYMRISEFYNEHYVTYVKHDDYDTEIFLYCLNPSTSLMAVMEKVRSTIYFSATLSPISYYTTLLGEKETSMKLQFQSPFDENKRLLLIQNNISTRYQHRSLSIPKLIELLYRGISQKEGNYIAFFPSYQYMRQVFEGFQFKYPNIRATMQEQSMSETEKQDFLSYFDEQNETHLLFCVLGGMFSEGIDLKGEKLIGAFIIGVGLPKLSEEVNLIKDYFNENSTLGYHYAYTFPGMSKVLQAAGRVIRSSEDTGIIVCIDDRFATPLYQQLFPMHMKNYVISSSISESEYFIKNFWKKQDTE